MTKVASTIWSAQKAMDTVPLLAMFIAPVDKLNKPGDSRSSTFEARSGPSGQLAMLPGERFPRFRITFSTTEVLVGFVPTGTELKLQVDVSNGVANLIWIWSDMVETVQIPATWDEGDCEMAFLTTVSIAKGDPYFAIFSEAAFPKFETQYALATATVAPYAVVPNKHGYSVGTPATCSE